MRTLKISLVAICFFMAIAMTACSTSSEQEESISEVPVGTATATVPQEIRGHTVMVTFSSMQRDADPAIGEQLQQLTGQPVHKINYGYASVVSRFNHSTISVPDGVDIGYVYRQGGQFFAVGGDNGEFVLSVSDEMKEIFFAATN